MDRKDKDGAVLVVQVVIAVAVAIYEWLKPSPKK